MKKFLISLAVIIASAGYFIWARGASVMSFDDDGSTGALLPTVAPANTQATLTPNPTANLRSTSNPTPSPVRYTGFKDGTYTSPVTDALYGSLQFNVVISGGKITDVKFIQYPDSSGRSLEVSNFALPILKQEAIVSQTANVQAVSGATQTSGAFQQGLSAVLVQAR